MVTVYWKFTRSPYSNNSWGSDTNLTELYDPVVTVKAGDGKDSFSFKVDNINGDYDTYFNPNDKIVVSRQQNSDTGWSNNDVLLTGAIRNVPEESDSSKDFLRIEGYNFSESVMNALVFVDGAGKPLNEFLQDALNSVRVYNTNFGVTWSSSNPSVKYVDGGAFPAVNERVFNKPLSYIFEKYSTKESTGDGRYYWFVNKDNELVWDKRLDDTNGRTFNEATDSHKAIKVSKDINDVKNFVIIKGGLDPKNNPMQDRYADYSSIAKHGFRYYIFAYENKTGLSDLDVDQLNKGVDDMADASYPLTPTWDSSVTATSYDNYVDEYRAYFKNKLREEGKKFVDLRKNGKLKVSITFQAGDKTWGLGDVVAVNIPSLSSNQSKLLRVEEIQYSTTTDTFTLIEDEGTI